VGIGCRHVRRIVREAIHFDGEKERATVEVDDVSPDDVLAVEAVAQDLAVAEAAPESPLTLGHATPQPPGKRLKVGIGRKATGHRITSRRRGSNSTPGYPSTTGAVAGERCRLLSTSLHGMTSLRSALFLPFLWERLKGGQHACLVAETLFFAEAVRP
jgi:hypothetical protein